MVMRRDWKYQTKAEMDGSKVADVNGETLSAHTLIQSKGVLNVIQDR